VLALAVLCLGALVGFAPSAEAQTAHFSGAVISLGSGFNLPSGVAMDGSGNVFVADSINNAVKEILAVDGYTTVNTLGSGFNQPGGVFVAASGNVFVADGGNSAVKEIMTQGVNLGSAAIGTITPLTIPLTFTFDTAGTIGAPAVLTQGAAIPARRERRLTQAIPVPSM
jgi:streptogramin lyase